MRFFRAAEAVYEAIRSQLDAAYGYPNPETKTQTAIPPASEAIRDSFGRILMAASAAECDYVLPSQLLPELLASGAVEEIDAATYQAALPQTP